MRSLFPSKTSTGAKFLTKQFSIFRLSMNWKDGVPMAKVGMNVIKSLDAETVITLSSCRNCASLRVEMHVFNNEESLCCARLHF